MRNSMEERGRHDWSSMDIYHVLNGIGFNNDIFDYLEHEPVPHLEAFLPSFSNA